jgi:FixJ family two-component response regulator
MAERRHIHIIDPDTRRRAEIAYKVTSRGLHAEIYEDLQEFAAKVPHDGVILLADEPESCTIAALKEVLLSAGKPLPFAVYSEEALPQKIVAAMHEGAVDYLRWPFMEALLESALARLAGAGLRNAKRHRREAAAKAAVAELSGRELEVLELMMLGKSNKEIGAELGISPRTVEIHRGNMLRKLNAKSPYDAARLALLAGLDVDEERIAA